MSLIIILGHHTGARIADNILQCGYYWPTIYKDGNDYTKAYDQCQSQGNISQMQKLLMTTVFEIELFDVGGIDFMVPFVRSHGMKYILVGLDYVSKWVQAIMLPNI